MKWERMPMPPEAFMDQIYQGRLDRELFDSFRAPRNTAKIDRIVRDYLDMLQVYDPRSIEEAGRIPQEMLEQMKKSGFFGLSIPEEYGGLGFNGWEYLKTIEKMVLLYADKKICFQSLVTFEGGQ
jgi:alkylation response protein AidB-like acyl-CoA dehydrogenase